MTPLRRFRSGLVGRVSSSSRVRYALIAAGLSSLGGFALSISLAHRLSIQQFGNYAISMAIIALVVGFAHAGIAEPMLSIAEAPHAFRIGMRRASTIGLIAAALLLPMATIIHSTFMLWAGVSIHGLVLYDLVRTFNTAIGRAALGAVQECAWLAVSAALALLILAGVVSPSVGFSICMVTGALIGYAAALMARTNPLPSWPTSPVSTGTSVAFGCDYLVGSGSSQILTTALGSIGQVAVVGALRAGGTLMGPITLALGVSRTLLIPHLANSKRNATSGPDDAAPITLLMALLALPLLTFIAFLPEQIGTLILGQNWEAAQPLMPFLSAEALFIVVTAAPFAGHRAHLAARRSLFVRLTMTAFRIALVFTAAVVAGAVAASAAMALVALTGCAVWWSSYIRLRRAVGQIGNRAEISK